MTSIKSIIVSSIIAFCAMPTNAGVTGAAQEPQTNNQSAVYASERVLIVQEARVSYAPDYRPVVCLPHYRIRTEYECTDSNGKNAWQYLSDVAPIGFKFSRFFKPDRYTVFIVFEPK